MIMAINYSFLCLTLQGQQLLLFLLLRQPSFFIQSLYISNTYFRLLVPYFSCDFSMSIKNEFHSSDENFAAAYFCEIDSDVVNVEYTAFYSVQIKTLVFGYSKSSVFAGYMHYRRRYVTYGNAKKFMYFRYLLSLRPRNLMNLQSFGSMSNNYFRQILAFVPD